MIKIYLLAVATGLSVALIYGLLVPSLISTKSDLAVMLQTEIASILATTRRTQSLLS